LKKRETFESLTDFERDLTTDNIEVIFESGIGNTGFSQCLLNI